MVTGSSAWKLYDDALGIRETSISLDVRRFNPRAGRPQQQTNVFASSSPAARPRRGNITISAFEEHRASVGAGEGIFSWTTGKRHLLEAVTLY